MGARSEAPDPVAQAGNAAVQAAVQVVGGQPAARYLSTKTGSSRIRQASDIILIGVSDVERAWVTDGEGKRFTDFVTAGDNRANEDKTQVEYTPLGIRQETPSYENISANVTFQTTAKWESLLTGANGQISTIQQTESNITLSSGPDTYLSGDKATGLLLRHNKRPAPPAGGPANGPVGRVPPPNLVEQVPGDATAEDSVLALLSQEISLKKGLSTLVKLEANQITLTVAGQGITISNDKVSIGSELEVRGSNVNNRLTTLNNALIGNARVLGKMIAQTDQDLRARIQRSEKALKDLEELGKKRAEK